MYTLERRVALVTGSSRGIGAAIARRLARAGAAVAVHGRDERAVAGVVGDITREGGQAIALLGDLTRKGDVEAMRAQVQDALGPVDVLVANAGGSFTPPGPLEDTPEGGWRATVDGNLTATFLTIQAFLPGMKALGRGSVVTVSSAAGRRPHPRSPVAYAAAKAGIQMMTQHLAAQAGPFGVRVNCVAPATILTEGNLERIPAEMQRTLAAAHTLRRLGTPEDVAEAVLWLASDASSWITGVILDIDGGGTP